MMVDTNANAQSQLTEITTHSNLSTDTASSITLSLEVLVNVSASNVTNSSSSTPSTSTSFCAIGGSLQINYSGRNKIWTYFRVYAEKPYRTHAYCLLCTKDINYGVTHSTSVLEKHVQRHHIEVYNGRMTKRASKRKCTETNLKSTQTSLSSYMANFQEYEDSLLNWIITTYQPLVATQPGFASLFTWYIQKRWCINCKGCSEVCGRAHDKFQCYVPSVNLHGI